MPAALSVIIPTRRRPALLAHVLDGLSALDYPADLVETIVVDDDPAAMSWSRFGVTVIRGHGKGLNAARNLGTAVARHDILCFLDDDVEVPSGWARAVSAGVGSHPGASCFAGRIELRLEGEPPRLCETCRRIPLATALTEPGRWAWGSNMILRREALARAGPFDERLPVGGDEVEWQRRLEAAGGSIVFLADAVVTHRRTAEDLRPLRLLKSRYVRGRNNAVVASYTGSLAHHPWKALLVAPIHALGRGCFGGLLKTAGLTGHEMGRLTYPRRRKRLGL